MKGGLRSLLLVLLGLVCSASLSAHEIRPGLLVITERSPGWYDVTWKVPTKGEFMLGIAPELPEIMQLIGAHSYREVPGALIRRSTYRIEEGSLVGQTITIEGIRGVQTDVLLRIQLQDGRKYSAIIRGSDPQFTIPELASAGEVAWSYSQMGFIHILEGIDHLLFLAALLLLVAGFWPMIKTVTAFTIAHSLTLALATLGLVNFPSAPTEAVISLSIVFLAVEVVRKRAGKQVFAARYPWRVAFAFGLFHGLGFAGALSEIGVPEHEVPLSLLMFNLGVEGGQIVFVIGVLALLAFVRRVPMPSREQLENGCNRLVPYAIGGVAAFWTIDRSLSFV